MAADDAVTGGHTGDLMPGEGVAWYIPTTPIEISPARLDAFTPSSMATHDPWSRSATAPLIEDNTDGTLTTEGPGRRYGPHHVSGTVSTGPSPLAMVTRPEEPQGVDGSTRIEVTVARFRALGDPTRLRVIDELTHGSRCVCEIRDRINVPAPLLSHHLGVLRNTGLVTSSRRGRWVDCTLDTGVLAATFASVVPPSGSVTR